MTEARRFGPDAGDPAPASSANARPAQIPPSSLPDFDWSRFGLQQIWQMVARQSQYHGHVAGSMWAEMRALCASEADKLEKALQQLAEHWPMEQEAARLFQEWGAQLVFAMRQTTEAARKNGPVVSSISREVEVAKGRLAELMEQKAEYERMEAERGQLLTEMTALGRDWFGGDFNFGTWRSDLDHQAREIMLHLERNIAKHGDEIAWDPPYQPDLGPPVAIGTDLEGDPESSGGNPLPGSLGRVPQVRIPDPESGGWVPSGPGAGPGPGDGLGPGPGAGAGFEDSTLGGETVLGAGPGGSGGPVPAGGGVFVDTPAGRAFAPGAVIGAPGVGGGVASGAVAGPAAGPAAGGGVGRPGGPGMVPFMPPMMGAPAGGRGAGTAGSGRRVRRGSSSVFETPQGPSGVIRPPEEPAEHDPGPGVIGIDR